MTIVKKGKSYVLLSKTTGRTLGKFDSKKKAQARERQIQYFKHKDD
jgi:hypothetical protein